MAHECPQFVTTHLQLGPLQGALASEHLDASAADGPQQPVVAEHVPHIAALVTQAVQHTPAAGAERTDALVGAAGPHLHGEKGMGLG
jgi:hypothetical protein